MISDHDPKTIEREFSDSWDSLEQFYVDFLIGPLPWLKPILHIFAELRQRGYDRQFRAGQSMNRFILSRARRDGLRREQARLIITVHPEGGMTTEYYKYPDVTIEVNLEGVEITEEVEQQLTQLLKQPID